MDRVLSISPAYTGDWEIAGTKSFQFSGGSSRPLLCCRNINEYEIESLTRVAFASQVLLTINHFKLIACHNSFLNYTTSGFLSLISSSSTRAARFRHFKAIHRRRRLCSEAPVYRRQSRSHINTIRRIPHNPDRRSRRDCQLIMAAIYSPLPGSRSTCRANCSLSSISAAAGSLRHGDRRRHGKCPTQSEASR